MLLKNNWLLILENWYLYCYMSRPEPLMTTRVCVRKRMRLRRLWWILPVLSLLFAGTAKADTVRVDGTYAFPNNGNGIPPYGGTLNGQSEAFYCVDFSATIKAGDTWSVNITSLTGSNFSTTRLWATLGAGAKTAYLEMAWLVTQMMGTSSKLLQAEDQYAIWSFTGGPNPYGTNNTLVAAALAAVKGGFTGGGFEILSPTGSTGQEFFIRVPEPSELLMLIIGLITVGLAIGKKRVAREQAS